MEIILEIRRHTVKYSITTGGQGCGVTSTTGARAAWHVLHIVEDNQYRHH